MEELEKSESKMMRISQNPIRAEGILVDDRLGTEGYIRLYEPISGALYISTDLFGLNNVVLVAEIEIAKSGDRSFRIRRFFCEYGYEDLLEQLRENRYCILPNIMDIGWSCWI